MSPPMIPKPRIVIEITPEQRIKLNQFLAYGEQRRVFNAILTDIIAMLDEFGHDFIVYILEREFTYRNQMVRYYADRQFGNTTLSTITTSQPDRIDTADS